MIRNLALVLVLCIWSLLCPASSRADVFLDWNMTLHDVIQEDGILNSPPLANPGWSSRAMAMANGAMYDAFQAVERTHQPLLVNMSAPGASKTAAAAQAAYDITLSNYPLRQSTLDAALAASLAMVPDDQSKVDGIALGQAIAQDYIAARTDDGADAMVLWPEGTLPGEWRSDPFHAPQPAWGPAWGSVQPFVLTSGSQFSVPGPPALDSPEYTAAFNQAKEWGALDSASRAANPDTTEIALFWAYDNSRKGAPPVLYLKNLVEIAAAAGTSPEENARLFALTTVSMADAMISSWDVKFADNFWRPITAIRADAGNDDDNPNTIEDPNWVYLGAPGANPLLTTDDFTPPFPAYTSGHSTMAGAVFKAIELFFGTNDFQTADMNFGTDTVTAEYELSSKEYAPDGSQGMVRNFTSFTQEGPIDLLMENSPEGEVATSRIYLGIHWIFDQVDGTYLGNDVAGYVFANRFQLIPEPSAIALGLLAAIGGGLFARRRVS